MGEKLKIIQYVLLIVLLVFGAVRTYQRHVTYEFSYHHDEWQHLGISKQIIDEKYNLNYNPFIGEERHHKDLESGFHLFLSSFFLMYDLNPINSYKYLASIFFIFSGLAIYVCVSKLSKNYLTGLVALIVFISLKSNVNILGNEFFVPMIMSLPFVFIYILNFKNIKLSFIILMFLLFIYPPTFILLFPTIFVPFFHNDNKNKKFYFVGFLLLGLLLILYLIWVGDIKNSLKYLIDLLYFEKGWGRLEVKFLIPLLYGIFNTILALFGFVKVFKKQKNFIIFSYLAFFNLTLITIFNTFDFSIIIPYSRAVHYTMIAFIPLTSFGFVYLIDKLVKKNYTKYIVSLIFLLIILNSKYSLDENFKNYSTPVLTKSGYNSLKWFNENYGVNHTLITPFFMTSAVYPISKNKAVSLIPAQLDGGFIDENLAFYKQECEQKNVPIEKSKAEFVLSPLVIECNSFLEIYSNDFYIYKVT
ncbi:hypothetical protein HON49_01045 [archaeon]|nr:hypothetical protein [archaeon]